MSDKIRQRLEQTGSLQVLAAALLEEPLGEEGEQPAELEITFGTAHGSLGRGSSLLQCTQGTAQFYF